MSCSIWKVLLCPILGTHVANWWLLSNRYFEMCFHTLKDDAILYVYCEYTRLCVIPEVLNGSALVSISYEKVRVQSLRTMIRPEAEIPIALSRASFMVNEGYSGELHSVVLQFLYRMLENLNGLSPRVLYDLH